MAGTSSKSKGLKKISLSSPTVEYIGGADNLEMALSHYSVVIAEPVKKMTQAYDSDEIVTWYKFKVVEYLSQRLTPACPNCSVPDPPEGFVSLQQNEFGLPQQGGSLTIDGVIVEMASPSKSFELGKRYLLLISQYPSGTALVCGGPVGAFTVSDDGSLEPLSDSFHPIKEEVKTRFASSVYAVGDYLYKRNMARLAAARS